MPEIPDTGASSDPLLSSPMSDRRPGARVPTLVVGRLARWSTRHRAIVTGGWLTALVIAMAASQAAHPHYVNNLSLPGTDSQRAADLLRRDFPAQAGDIDQIVLYARHRRIGDPAVRAHVAPVLARVSRLPHVTGVISPFTPAGARGVSPAGRTAFATVTFDQRADTLPKAAVDRVIAVAATARSSDLQVDLGGRAIQTATRPPLGATTAIGLLAAMVVLLITFGSALAMGLPIITALLGLGTALGLVGLGSRLLDTPDFATQLGALLGLGVGIDYALFIVTRFRESHRAGHDLPTSITTAMETAGRAVLLAGMTVITALLGMLVLGVSLLDAAALASALSVALTMLAALTMLPVLLSRFGERIARRGRAAHTATGGAFWPRWAALVTRHPWPPLLAGLTIMLVLAAPALSLRLGQSDAGNDPRPTPRR